ncbi:MAG: hypothetical protein FD153_183 [Rhodospirillaceae bacterium]|nr:MAG: hypothetical protein FD153_183 [Rhodospirillaceae bacterium]
MQCTLCVMMLLDRFGGHRGLPDHYLWLWQHSGWSKPIQYGITNDDTRGMRRKNLRPHWLGKHSKDRHRHS